MTPSRGGFPLRRLWLLAALIAVIVLVYGTGLHHQLSPETLVRYRADIVRFVSEQTLLAVAAYIVLYIGVIALSIPIGVFMTITGGFLFGTLWGGVATIVGATIGSALIFCIAKTTLGEPLMRRAGPLAARFAAGFREDAFSYLLFLRLLPVPFWLVNLAPALFGVKLKTFVAATFVGIIPATFAFSFFGAGLDSVIQMQEAPYLACLADGRGDCRVHLDLSQVLTPTFVGALVALGCVALIPVLAKKLWGKRVAVDPANTC